MNKALIGAGAAAAGVGFALGGPVGAAIGGFVGIVGSVAVKLGLLNLYSVLQRKMYKTSLLFLVKAHLLIKQKLKHN